MALWQSRRLAAPEMSHHRLATYPCGVRSHVAGYFSSFSMGLAAGGIAIYIGGMNHDRNTPRPLVPAGPKPRTGDMPFDVLGDRSQPPPAKPLEFGGLTSLGDPALAEIARTLRKIYRLMVAVVFTSTIIYAMELAGLSAGDITVVLVVVGMFSLILLVIDLLVKSIRR